MKVLAVLIAIVTVILAVYVGVVVLLVGGVEMIVDGIDANPNDGNKVGWGIVRVVFASAGASFTLFVGFLAAIALWAASEKNSNNIPWWRQF